MTAILRRLDPPSLGQQLRATPAMTRPLMFEIIDRACRRVASFDKANARHASRA